MQFSYSKIRPEDYPKQKEFMPSLSSIINLSFTSLVQLFNKNITFRENIAGDILTVNIDGNFPVNVRWTNKSMPIAAWIGKCYETSGKHTNYSSALFLDWEMLSNSEFRINAIPGLTATTANPFKLTIVAITG